MCAGHFEKAHIVCNWNEDAADTNFSLDEAMERGIIRDTKIWHTNNPQVLVRSTSFTILVAKSNVAVAKQLKSAFTKSGINADIQPMDIVRESRRKSRNREKRMALNVIEILEFLDDKGFLGDRHVRSPNLLNSLCEPPLVVSDRGFIDQIIHADETGRFAAALHIRTKLSSIFHNCKLTDEDRHLYFDDKLFSAILGHWNKK